MQFTADLRESRPCPTCLGIGEIPSIAGQARALVIYRRRLEGPR